MEAIAKALISIGWTLTFVVWFALVYGYIALTHRHGFGQLIAVLSPFNLWNWGLTAVAFALGALLAWAGHRLYAAAKAKRGDIRLGRL